MRAELYYTAPPDEAFNELKREAVKIWMGYDEPYRTEKLNRITEMYNIEDNFMYIVAMFDQYNQQRLANNISRTTRNEVRARMIDGGTPYEFIYF